MQPCCRYFRPSLENKTHPNFSISSLKKTIIIEKEKYHSKVLKCINFPSEWEKLF